MRSEGKDAGPPMSCRQWQAETLSDDGRRIFVETMAGTRDEAAVRVRSLGWVGSVIGCKALGVLGEEVRVVPDEENLGCAMMLTEVEGTRRWVVLSGEPEEDWWTEVGAHGERMPGEWEYDRVVGTVVCSTG